MKRININNKNNSHFIGSWKMDDDQLMEDLVDFFNKNHESHKQGEISTGAVDKKKKDCLDLFINPKEAKEKNDTIILTYIDKLASCYQDYAEQWDYVKNWKKIYIGPFVIQKHLKSGHHKAYHVDRKNISESHKIFSWVTFLNDVSGNEGKIHFKYFNLSIKPERGKTLIWPSEWTHAHNEEPTIKSEKYLIKGSFHFPDTLNE